MATVKEEMNYTQFLYKRNFEERVMIPQRKVRKVPRVFVRKDSDHVDEPRHKCSPIETSQYLVTEVDDKICVILRNEKFTESITLD